MKPDNLQVFVLGLLQIEKEHRRPIWVITNGALITGIVISQYDKNLIDMDIVKKWLDDSGRPMNEVTERELNETSLEESQFDGAYIHFENAAVYFGGFSFISTTTVNHAQISAWGLGNPPVKSIPLG